MKKNSFMEGAMIATIGIVLCKVLGLVYVVPFYNIIGTKGGALYSYAYSIYSIFLSLSMCGIPIAISKLISEYDELNFQYTKQKVYKIASTIIRLIGIAAFVLLFITAPLIANVIIGGVEGGNTVSEITIAIRIVSLALLVVPQLSIVRGYFQGHKFITSTSISEVIEQSLRVAVIIIGSYVSVKILDLPIEYAVYVAILGATLGAVFSLVYLKIKYKNIPIKTSKKMEVEEKISTKKILKQIICYALPFVLIDLLKSAYGMVDSLTVVKTMVNLGYDTASAETALGVMATWGTKLNMIVISISLGLTVSLVPNIAGSAAKKDYKDINDKINQSIMLLLYTTLPMAFGISFLATPVWVIFYGYNLLSIKLFQMFILQVVFFGLYTTIINLAQSMNETKIALGSLFGSFIAKVLLNIPMMYLCKYIRIEAYFGPTITNALVEFITFIIVLYKLKKKHNFDYKHVTKNLPKILISIFVMIIVLNLVNMVRIPNQTRFMALINIIIYASIGSSIYIFTTHKLGLIEDVFKENKIQKIIKKIIKK